MVEASFDWSRVRFVAREPCLMSHERPNRSGSAGCLP
jgi:hypothetical protein